MAAEAQIGLRLFQQFFDGSGMRVVAGGTFGFAHGRMNDGRLLKPLRHVGMAAGTGLHRRLPKKSSGIRFMGIVAFETGADSGGAMHDLSLETLLIVAAETE